MRMIDEASLVNLPTKSTLQPFAQPWAFDEYLFICSLNLNEAAAQQQMSE